MFNKIFCTICILYMVIRNIFSLLFVMAWYYFDTKQQLQIYMYVNEKKKNIFIQFDVINEI